ncbi:alpha/beta hydrolase [Streptomyces palmae]|nr:alpha/beta hydrolase [Streptomyces palmae]
MKVSALRDLKRATYETASEGWRKVSDQAGTDMTWVETHMLKKLGEQDGDTKNAAVKTVRMLAHNYQYIQMQCGLIRATLNGLAQELQHPQSKLKTALANASENGLTVHDDGSVSYPAAVSHGKNFPGGTIHGHSKKSKGVADDLNQENESAADALERQADAQYEQAGEPKVKPKQHLAEQLAQEIADALRVAGEVDLQYSNLLARLTAKLGGVKVTPDMLLDEQADRTAVQRLAGDEYAKGDIPKGKSPEANAAWWKGLSKEEQDAYLSLYPSKIGALDGIPSKIRDEANRTVLSETRAKYDRELKNYSKEPPKWEDFGAKATRISQDWRDWNARKSHLETAIHGMDAIQERFDRTGQNGVPRAYLLGFDPEKHDGRVILATGDPDTADHTAVYVPGTKTLIGGIGGDLSRGERLWATSHAVDPHAKVATITWLGYDAPDDLPSAAKDRWAKAGGPDLRQFLDGVAESHESASGDRAHTTLIGHSYGSTVIGDATKSHTSYDPDAGPLAVDDIVAAGSPGMQVAGRLTSK